MGAPAIYQTFNAAGQVLTETVAYADGATVWISNAYGAGGGRQ